MSRLESLNDPWPDADEDWTETDDDNLATRGPQIGSIRLWNR